MRVRNGRPFVTVKLAQTADGFGAGEWARLIITGEGANARTHMLRAHADAVLVGVATVIADDPRLDVRLPGMEERSPARVVIDSSLQTPLTSRLIATASERPTFILCRSDADPEAEGRLSERGAQVLRVAADGRRRLDLRAALSRLAETGLTRVLCEGGPTLADALARDDLVDEAVLVTNERPFGGPGLNAVGRHLAAALAGSLRQVCDEQVGPDLIRIFERPS
jgi:diaminohydroxyphosphoribosylaminopyrimidine deaminase/5-amino-6-(5-phosphoribosylamino)uracil reductase